MRRILPLVLSLAAFAGCGGAATKNYQNFSQADTRCTSGMAQMAVFDGSAEILCGCAEAAQLQVPAQVASLTCTVPVGTTVFFHYIGTRRLHSIISTGSPTFVSSPLNDPKALLPYRAHGVVFSVTGTYTFQDVFNNTVKGQVVVQ